MDARAQRWALVTGASSGLGAEFARQLAGRGYDVVLVARRRDRLEALAGELQASGRSTHVHEADLASDGAIERLLGSLSEHGIAPELLVNNAGFGSYGPALDPPLERTRAMLQLNVVALTELAVALGRRMAAGGGGAIVNVSSTSGFQPDPWMAVYGASKAYVTSFSLALAEELESRGVHVLAFCPGPTRTEFNAVADVNAAHDFEGLYMEAEACVRYALRALDGRRRLAIPGTLNRVAALMGRLSPPVLVARVNRWLLAPRHGEH